MRRDRHTVDLFAEQAADGGSHLVWPDSGRFPLNVEERHVEQEVERDLREAPASLVISGYASLDRLIDLASAVAPEQQLRWLFGNEPYPSQREDYSLSDDDLPERAERYWLSRNISLLRSAALLRTIERLRSGRIEARYVPGARMMHAKLYVTDKAVTLGSSNYTAPGMAGQLEANARFTVKDDPTRYRDARLIAENYWRLGRSYLDQLLALLEKLLRAVTWREALARACAELLEGEWAQVYLRDEYLPDAGKLWPSQKQGIAQALYVLHNQGSVLIADATGAGKTRMGVYLIAAMQDDIVRRGRLRRGLSVMISPPTVMDNWERESLRAGVSLEVGSHGGLSHAKSRRHEITVEQLKRAQLLCVDEGHNFLNIKSNRTQQLLRNMADHVVLLTATPINRGVSDLLRIADMLGADNLAESTLKAFQKMLGVQNLSRSLTEPEIELLRTEIQRFTVRRTKAMLNTLIDREPEQYRDYRGELCRFPKHLARLYSLNEPEEDREYARRIKALAEGLHGVTHFVQPLEMPEVLAQQGISAERYLQGRLGSARKLARYMVMRALRSSRAALYEHVHGTAVAIEQFGIQDFSKHGSSGDVVSNIRRIAGRPPENRLGVALPDWLCDGDAHRRACEHDAKSYEQIAALGRQMSEQRERRKAAQLAALISRHDLVLAYDSRPISLAVIRQLLRQKHQAEVLMAWGDEGSDRADVLKVFAQGSQKRRVIGLCSDSLSEGVNLQAASVLLHLDMPSVVRIAEQRVGRVDRMDSPHAQIEAWWPEDAPEFALSSDERFIERYETVEKLLGSNMPLPETMQRSQSEPLSAQQLIEEYEKAAAKPWDGINDAFAPVRALVEGEEALVPPEVYERYRRVSERVLSRVSLVRARSPWAFFCLAAGDSGAPRWILFPNYNGEAQTELEAVAEGLRQRLQADTEDLSMDAAAAKTLEVFVQRLSRVERKLLSRKKQRALEELEFVLERLLAQAPQLPPGTDAHLLKIRSMLRAPSSQRQPDWDAVASRWLDVIRPVWFEKLSDKKRHKPLLLKDIRRDLLADPLRLAAQLEQHFRRFPLQTSPEQRIAACIIGIG